jgi:hypothetical protein
MNRNINRILIVPDITSSRKATREFSRYLTTET